MAPRYNSDIASDAVSAIVVSYQYFGLRCKWVSSSTMEEALKQRYDFLKHLELTSTLLSEVMPVLIIDSLQQSNPTTEYLVIGTQLLLLCCVRPPTARKRRSRTKASEASFH